MRILLFSLLIACSNAHASAEPNCDQTLAENRQVLVTDLIKSLDSVSEALDEIAEGRDSLQMLLRMDLSQSSAEVLQSIGERCDDFSTKLDLRIQSIDEARRKTPDVIQSWTPGARPEDLIKLQAIGQNLTVDILEPIGKELMIISSHALEACLNANHGKLAEAQKSHAEISAAHQRLETLRVAFEKTLIELDP